MPWEIVRNDITRMRVDAIVNTANPWPRVGSGVDEAIHRSAGPELLRAREVIGPMAVGQCAVTPGFDLTAKFVIHTVGPVWRGGLFGEEGLLRKCYASALALAAENGCESVAFPLISAGNYGFPARRALSAAVEAITAFLMEREMQVYLVVFDREAMLLSEKLQKQVRSFIDDNHAAEYRPARRGEYSASLRECCAAPMAAAPLEELLRATDAGFSERLLQLIDATGQKDSAIYTRANVSRQHFSKIRNNPDYRPTKATAIAFAIALELDLDQTRDLIGRAGYALTNASKFDVIIMYFIGRKNYDLSEINAALFEFDQSLLGV